ncbi:MAG: hypothetical protein IAF38_22030 [Bacteroidia bacterium]|nr:hypothetical protein [Bacteroidia bacterium]
MAFTTGNYVSAFLASMVYVGRGGVPIALGCKFNLLQTLASVAGGGVFSSFIFSFLFDGVIHWVSKILDKKFPNRKLNKKKFTRWNRFIIKVKKNFGVVGVACVSTLILSIPLGTFLALRFFGGRKTVFMWFSIFTVFWTIALFYTFGGGKN